MPHVAPKTIVKPWGHELLFAEAGPYVGKVLHIRAGEALSRQYHELKSEHFLVMTGEVVLELGSPVSARHTLTPGDGWHIEVGTVHRLVAVSDAAVVEVSTPEVSDVVRLEDRYGREGSSEP